MSVLSKGTTFSTGQQVTATNLNNVVDSATFLSGATDSVTTQLSGGAIIVKDGGISTAKLNDTGLKALSGLTPAADRVAYFNGASTSALATLTTFGRSLIDDADAATSRTTLGIDLSSGSVLSSTGTGGTSQTGTAGADLLFNTSGAPTVTLTAGTWLVLGSVRTMASGAATSIRPVFRNTTDGTEFGSGSSSYNGTGYAESQPCFGVTTIASGSKAVYFKLYNSNEAAGSIVAGSSTSASAIPGYILAVKLLS